MTVAEQFGRSLCSWREWAGLTQQELGRLADLHRTEISLLERGLREPRLLTIVKLADAFQVDPPVMLKGIGRRDG